MTNMLGRPDLVQDISIYDGEHFFPGSMAQYSFTYITSADADGFSRYYQGEVFEDAVAVHREGDSASYEVEIPEDMSGSYLGDVYSRQLVAVAVFGYELPHEDYVTSLDQNDLLGSYWSARGAA